MKPIDIILLTIIAALLIVMMRNIYKSWVSGRCDGCSSNKPPRWVKNYNKQKKN